MSPDGLASRDSTRYLGGWVHNKRNGEYRSEALALR